MKQLCVAASYCATLTVHTVQDLTSCSVQVWFLTSRGQHLSSVFQTQTHTHITLSGHLEAFEGSERSLQAKRKQENEKWSTRRKDLLS